MPETKFFRAARMGHHTGVIFQTPTDHSAPVPKFLNPDSGPASFQLEKPTSVQTPATTDPTKIYPCFHFRNEHTDSCCCWNWNVTQDPGPFFHNNFTADPSPNKKRKILLESTPALGIDGHLWFIGNR